MQGVPCITVIHIQKLVRYGCACTRHEDIWRTGGIAPLILNWALDGVSGQLHVSDNLFPGKDLPVRND